MRHGGFFSPVIFSGVVPTYVLLEYRGKAPLLITVNRLSFRLNKRVIACGNLKYAYF